MQIKPIKTSLSFGVIPNIEYKGRQFTMAYLVNKYGEYYEPKRMVGEQRTLGNLPK